MEKHNISRRHFLGTAAVLGAAAAAPFSLTASSPAPAAGRKPRMRKIAPGQKVNMAFCGIGNRGEQIFNDFIKTQEINVVAFCDTDMGAPHTLKVLKKYPNVPRFQDFRVMLEKMGKEIDALCIGVPDHSHFPIAMLAMSMGKHVYVEKPLARTYEEVSLLMQAARKYGVVTQLGNQGHSDANYFQFKAWVEAGIIKDVTAINAHMNNPRRWHSFDPKMKDFPTPAPVPSTLDWDTWLGVVPFHEYRELFVNGDWRSWYDFGLGALGDWGAHILDTAHEFLHLGLPTVIEPERLDEHNPFFFPMSTTLHFHFPERQGMPAVKVSWYDGIDNLPPIPSNYGTSELAADIPTTNQGEYVPLKLNPGKEIYTKDKDLVFKGGSHGSTLSMLPSDRAKELSSRLPEVPKSPSNHFLNFVRACRGEEKSRSPFEISGPLCQTFNLGVIAQRLGQKLVFDPVTERITNNMVADCLLKGPAPRKGWEWVYKL